MASTATGRRQAQSPIVDPSVRKRSVIVTAKANPDLDGVACAVAYAELLRNGGELAAHNISGRPDAEARLLIELVNVEVRSHSSGDCDVVLVDASDTLGLPEFVDPLRVVEVIDHRLPHEAERVFPSARVQVELVGAAATLVFERFTASGVAPSHASGVLLQAAIVSNTQLLRGSVTTCRDVQALQRLRAEYPVVADLTDRQFRARKIEVLADFTAALVRESKTFTDNHGTFLVSQIECPGAVALVSEALAWSAGQQMRNMVNLVDPILASSKLVVSDSQFRAEVSARTGLTFVESVATSDVALMRKQVVALYLGGRR